MSFGFLEEHENVLDMYTEDNHIPKIITISDYTVLDNQNSIYANTN